MRRSVIVPEIVARSTAIESMTILGSGDRALRSAGMTIAQPWQS
jgi:hypothetical protein